MIFERTLLHLIGQLCHGAAVGGGGLGARGLIFAQCGVGEGVGMCVGLIVGLAVVCLLNRSCRYLKGCRCMTVLAFHFLLGLFAGDLFNSLGILN